MDFLGAFEDQRRADNDFWFICYLHTVRRRLHNYLIQEQPLMLYYTAKLNSTPDKLDETICMWSVCVCN